MSKERLEEIVEKISEQTFDRIIVPQTKITIEYQDIKFLINAITKQDERVQGLEENAQDLREALGKRQEQVKRYREVVEKLNNPLPQHEYTAKAYADYVISVLKAMEGEK